MTAISNEVYDIPTKWEEAYFVGISYISLDSAVIRRRHILWYVLHLIRYRCHWEEAYFVGMSYTSLDNAVIRRRNILWVYLTPH
jgi:hypothetical protein